MLTKTQKATIENAVTQTGEVTLYRETSMSGKSETLRWQRRFVEQTRWGPAPRIRSGMILSVKINVLPDGSDDPKSWERYETLCEEAETYFNSLRANTTANGQSAVCH